MRGNVFKKDINKICYNKTIPLADDVIAWWNTLVYQTDFKCYPSGYPYNQQYPQLSQMVKPLQEYITSLGGGGILNVIRWDSGYIGYKTDLITEMYNTIPSLPYDYEDVAKVLIQQGIFPSDFPINSANNSWNVARWKAKWIRTILPTPAVIQIVVTLATNDLHSFLVFRTFDGSFIGFTERDESLEELIRPGVDIPFIYL